MNKDPGKQIQEQCTAEDARRCKEAEEFWIDVDAQVGIQKLEMATQPLNWITNHSRAPDEELAELYKIIALNWDDPKKIGEECRNVVFNSLWDIAKHIEENNQ